MMINYPKKLESFFELWPFLYPIHPNVVYYLCHPTEHDDQIISGQVMSTDKMEDTLI